MISPPNKKTTNKQTNKQNKKQSKTKQNKQANKKMKKKPLVQSSGVRPRSVIKVMDKILLLPLPKTISLLSGIGEHYFNVPIMFLNCYNIML